MGLKKEVLAYLILVATGGSVLFFQPAYLQISITLTKKLSTTTKKLSTTTKKPNMPIKIPSMQTRAAQIVGTWARRAEKVEEERENGRKWREMERDRER